MPVIVYNNPSRFLGFLFEFRITQSVIGKIIIKAKVAIKTDLSYINTGGHKFKGETNAVCI